MPKVEMVRKRTGWDVVLGVLLIIGSLSVLSNVVLATVVSVIFLGWGALVSGIVLLIAGLMNLRSTGAWSPVLGGAMLAILGFLILNRPVSAILALTLVTGAMFLATGIVRMVSSVSAPHGKIIFFLSGLISTLLGILILSNIWVATFKLLGTMLGVQILLEGVTLVVAGRLRVQPVQHAADAAAKQTDATAAPVPAQPRE